MVSVGEHVYVGIERGCAGVGDVVVAVEDVLHVGHDLVLGALLLWDGHGFGLCLIRLIPDLFMCRECWAEWCVVVRWRQGSAAVCARCPDTSGRLGRVAGIRRTNRGGSVISISRKGRRRKAV